MAVTDGARPRTTRSTSSLKTVRYEHSKQGIPPRKVASTTRLASDASTPPTTSASESSNPSVATPPPIARRQPPQYAVDGSSQRSSQVKRDSGIAPSVSTTDTAVTSLYSLTGAGGAARQPDLPTIVIQDEDNIATPGAALTDHSQSPFVQPPEPPMRNRARSTSKSASPPATASRRKMSFERSQGEALPISSSTSFASDDINLTDLTSDKLTFSTRGSLLFGGKRMQELIAAKGGQSEEAQGIENPSESSADKRETLNEQTQDKQIPKQEVASGTPKSGLVAGRREPSMQKMHAALQAGRVLSVEEMTFSAKVRNMYDYGNERAANWTTSATSGRGTPDMSGPSTATPETTDGDLSSHKIRLPKSRTSSINADPRSSFYSKEVNELAGGIEDWEDVDGRNVDRYGFIHPDRPLSQLSENSASHRAPTPGMQRVATSLRIEADQPRRDRRIKRRPASIRSSRSGLPGSSNGTIKKGVGSIYSTHSISNSSKPNLFRSRSRRALDDAADMLTPPPGLVDIEEDEDAGTTASMLKKREWSREQKWQKMARPVKLRTVAGKGGGMRFDFDTLDPKLAERTWKGIPDRWRATAWHSFLSASAKKRNSPATDEELIGQFYKLQGMSSADDVQIDVDVPRTINMHVMFRRRYRGGQRLLFRVLHAVSLYFPDVGYVQGMAALAVTLLCYYEEELAFVMMVRLWQLRGLEELFQSGFGGLMACLKQFETDWLRGGDVALKLEELGIDPTAWGTRWYLTLFNMSVPFPAQLRIWDVFMLLGDSSSTNAGEFGGADLDVLHAVSAAFIDATREILLDSDFENAMKVLTSFVPIKDEDLLMRVAKTEYRLKKKRDGVKV